MICKIIQENCIACGLCQVLAPELFDYNDDGLVLFSASPDYNEIMLTTDYQQIARQAAQRCPAQAIKILAKNGYC